MARGPLGALTLVLWAARAELLGRTAGQRIDVVTESLAERECVTSTLYQRHVRIALEFVENQLRPVG